MKIKGLIFLFFGFCFVKGYAQYQAANWPLLYNNLTIKITKDSMVRDSLPNGTSGFIANASISDSQGNLLFFSFGVDARDKTGAQMDSGCCLCEDIQVPDACIAYADGNPHMQGALILPRPGSNTQYYLFIKDMDSSFIDGAQQPKRVTVSLVDLSYNQGLGKVIQRSVPILTPLATLSDSRMTACKHANGRDWWLVNHEYNTNRIYTQMVSLDSIFPALEQNIGGMGLEPDAGGRSLFSPDGSVFATTTPGMGKITLLDFDRCSGFFSNFRAINYDSSEYFFTLAFSPNGRFLYAGNTYYLKQYDLQNIDTGLLVIHDTAAYPLLGETVLMPDDKIYIAGWTVAGECLSVIDSPDLKFPACNFHLRSVCVPGSVLIQNVPNFPNYNMGALAGSGCDTLNTTSPNLSKGEGQMQIRPNPADNVVYIEMGIQGDYELMLFNGIGQLLLTKETGLMDVLNTERLASGVYFIRVLNKKDNTEIGIRKLAVVH